MSNHFKSVKIESLDSDEENQFSNDDEYVTYPLPKEVGTGHGNLLKTSHDISIYKALHRYNCDLTSEPYDFGFIACEYTEESLVVDYASGGTIDVQYRDSENILSFGREKTLFRRLTGFEANYKHERSNHLEFVAFSIPLTSLRLIIGDKNIELLFSALKLTCTSSATNLTLPLRINSILKQAISPHLQGSMKMLYSQTKILEYLCELIEYVEKNSGALTVDEKHALKVQEVHDYLSKANGKPPSLIDLALRTDMSAQTLNAAFKKEFGMTVHRYMISKRLHEAHDAILETNIPLKLLADRVGYSHVNHFITAFKKEFTYPPGRLRTKKH